MNIHDIESKRKCKEAMKMNFKDELKAWAELTIALAILIMAIGFIYTMSQIPKELRGGIIKKIDDYQAATDARADQLEKNFDIHMKELDKKQNKYLTQMEVLCNQTKLQGTNTQEYSPKPRIGRNLGYIYSSPASSR